MATRLKGRLSLLLLASAVVLLIIPAWAFAQDTGDSTGTSAPEPTIQSDKEDYPPGGIVILSGSNWQPGESVKINVNDDEGKTWSRNVDVIADENGGVRDEFQLPDWFVATYYVTATGAESGSVAKTTFTDAKVAVKADLGSNQEWALRYEVYPNSTCAAPSSQAETKKGQSTSEIANPEVNASGSVKLYASDKTVHTSSSVAHEQFDKWTLVGSNTTFTHQTQQNVTGFDTYNAQNPNGTGHWICVPGQRSTDRTFVANYRVAVADTTAPTVSSINRANSSPTKASSVNWTVTFSESVTGVNAADFSLAIANPGLGGTPAITGVTGSGTTYTVTASTGTGSGTLGLNLVDDDTIVDGANNKLGGTDPGNGNFTGQVYTIDRSAPNVTLNQVNGSTVTFPYFTNQNVSSVGGSCDNGDGQVSVTLGGNATTPAKADCLSGSWTLTLTTALSSEGTYAFVASQTDAAGNPGSSGSNSVTIDKTAPRFNCPAADNTWHGSDVTLNCTASDSGSGLDPASDATFSLSTNVAADTETDNASTGTKTLKDAAGNTVTAPAITGNMVDKKAPAVVPADVTDTTWRNTDLSEDFTSSDGGSGLENTAADSSFTLTASAESANANTPTVVSRVVEDAVGNKTTRSVSALIDLTKPTISASVLNSPAPSGWYNIATGGPIVHFACEDLLSGIAADACPADHTITTDGPNQGYSDSVSDRAGNSESAGVSDLKVDLTAPDVAGAPDLLATSDSGDPQDNLTKDQTPTFNITAEAGSTVKLYAEKDGVETLLGSATATGGVATITSGPELSDGVYNVYAKVSDQAGNVSSTTGIQVTVVEIDATAPDAPGLDMVASSDTGVSNSDDTTNNDKPTFSGNAEAGSTVKLYDGASLLTSITVDASGSWSFTVVNALSEGTHLIKVTATDAADNTSDESQLSVVIDKTVPVISGQDINDTTWRKTDLSANFTAQDNADGSGLANTADASFTLTTSGESPDPNTPVSASRTVEDVAGNSATRTISALVDKTLPLLGITDNNLASYDICGTARPVKPTFNPTDALSGILASGTSETWTPNLQPSGVGSYTYKARATDNATNQVFYPGPAASDVKTYSVVYDPNYTDTLGAYSGVQQPINASGTRSSFKLGSTVPVKFQLRCGTTPLNSAVATLWVSKHDNKPDTAVNETIATNSPDIGNRFRVTDSATGQYQFNLSTKSGYVNPDNSTTSFSLGTYYLYIQLDDGTKFRAAQIDFNR